MGDVEIEKNLISQRCSPTDEILGSMKSFVDAVENQTLKHFLTVILCSGARASEALNGYVYYDDNNELTFSCLVLKKKRLTKWSMNKHRKFLGKDHLKALLQMDIWKDRTMINPFNLDVGWLNDNASFDLSDPNWLFDEKEIVKYSTMYRELKKVSKMNVRYNPNLYGWKKSRVVTFNPAPHFFRKAFCSELIRSGKMNAFNLTHYLNWEKMDTGLSYVRGYGNIEDKKMLDLITKDKFNRKGIR